MAWLAADSGGQEFIHEFKPKLMDKYIYKGKSVYYSYDKYGNYGGKIKLPKGTIEKLIGIKLTCNNKPVEI